ncbi:methionine/alanine import family NSS transporter small subunit [Demequina pelophila]|nr:methionine/alanine import family NSS transporter small subunit [Demequina pelophila]
MATDALVLMIVSIALLWGGLAASVVFLARRPERVDMPAGGEDDVEPHEI